MFVFELVCSYNGNKQMCVVLEFIVDAISIHHMAETRQYSHSHNETSRVVIN